MKPVFRYDVFAVLCALVVCGSCTSLVEKTGNVLDGSAFAQKNLAVYTSIESGSESQGDTVEVRHIREKDGNEYILIIPASMPALQFKGSVPAADGSFYLLSYSFLCSSLTGWNEFTMDLSGGGIFTINGQNGTLALHGALEPVGISWGKIRRDNKRITGDQALTALRNRYERILALTEWMHGRQDVPAFDNPKTFEQYWKPLLLPELVSAKKRPSQWSKDDAVWVRAEGRTWNTAYTELLFPEDLHILRNSGALSRDWDEAFGWIYLQYNFHGLAESLTVTMPIRKSK